jgi:hypothetical protein
MIDSSNRASFSFVHLLLGKTAKTTTSLSLCVVLSVYTYCRSAQNNSAPTGRISMKFDIW